MTPAVDRAETKSRYDIARDCVHCGLCLPVCPTYLHLGNEADSPRGRLYLMRAHEEGRQTVTPAFAEHLDLCLVCRACETACPSGVRFGVMMEEFRALLRDSATSSSRKSPSLAETVGRWLLLHVLPARGRLHRFVQMLRFVQATRMDKVAQRSGLLRLLGLDAQAGLAPRIPATDERRGWPAVLPAAGKRRARVLFLRGCVAPEFLPEVQTDSIAALRHNGCEVVTPPEQTCCGALHFHLGYRPQGLRLLERNLAAFSPRADFDAVIVNAAGCGSTLKEYGQLAHESAGLAAPAQEFAARVRDISEFLDALGLVAPAHAVQARVAYDEPCHLLHGQGVSAAPKRILAAIPGVEIVTLVEADRCCGSAGIYNLAHPELARAILQEKIRHIAASGADTVATGNAGCILQIRSGLQQAARTEARLERVRVVHPMQLLAAAYGQAPIDS